MLATVLSGAAGIALLASAVGIGSAAAQTPAVQPRPINACTTIASSGSYVVGTDLHASMGDCIDIAAPNVALDLGSRTLSGSSMGVGIGVHILSGAENVWIANGTISGFEYGVVSDAPHAHLTRLTVENNLASGILLRNASASTISGSYVVNNALYGISVQSSDHVSILNTRTQGSGTYGIWLNAVSSSVVSRDHVGPAGAAGIYLGCSPNAVFLAQGCAANQHNMMTNNQIDAGNGLGIVLGVHADANTIADNANSNGAYGAFDANATCGTNDWYGNSFTAVNAACIG